MGFISSASNGTMLCRLGDEAAALYAIYKPGEFERPLWDFPGELYLREVAAYEVSEFLGWGVVPPTVLRDGPRGPGSLQLFVPHRPAQHYFTLSETGRFDVELSRMAMFDMVANNADRKGGHVLLCTHEDRLYGIDHGLTFNAEPKLRTVIWDQPDVPFRKEWKDDVVRLRDALGSPEAEAEKTLDERLHELLTVTEVEVLAERADEVAGMIAMPRVHPDERWYPWPPI
jgi:uncharacterized repeat protein (TIGR03843 family)